jgi:hypothetical protein
MPKVKIGEKVTIGEDKKAEQKRFTNGHKCFTAPEAKALLETQSRETAASKNFQRGKYDIIRERNPITGDATPRMVTNAKGDVIGKVGVPLFTYEPAKRKTTEEEEQEIEEYLEKNQNPLKRSDYNEERILSLQNRQDVISGELYYLQQQIERKKQSLGNTSHKVSLF